MPRPMIKGCVFDLDGTLLNTLPTIARHGNQTLHSLGFAPYSAECFKEFVGDGARTLVRRMLTGRGVTDEAVFDLAWRDYVAAYDEDPDSDTLPYEGISSMLEQLQGKYGCRLAILSNKPTSSVKLLAKRFFPFSFTHIYGGDCPPEFLKPSPHLLHVIMNDWGIAPEECLMAGDMLPDAQVAANAGLTYGVSVTWGFKSAEALAPYAMHLAHTPHDIVALVEKSRHLA